MKYLILNFEVRDLLIFKNKKYLLCLHKNHAEVKAESKQLIGKVYNFNDYKSNIQA